MFWRACRHELWAAMKISPARLVGAVVCLFSLAAQANQDIPATPSQSAPNVIVILSDDMGFSDIGCYGGEIETPHLDGLASGGLRFTQFYNMARCCPTRASLLTGLYPHQAGIGHMMDDKGWPGYRGELGEDCRTIAELLRPAGYRTYAAGKWHVSRHTAAAGPKHNWPLQRGFDRFYGTIHGAGSFFDPSSLVRDETMISPYADPLYQPATYYYTDAITDHAVRFLRDHRQQYKERPFFLYVTYTAAHWPMHALPEDIAKYQGKYAQGFQAIRQARYEKACRLGVIDSNQPLPPPALEWEQVKDRQWEAACMEVYAAMVDRMDQGIGQIVGELKQQGCLDNTLILYLQDNGGCAEGMGRSGNQQHPDIPRPEKPTFPPLAATEFAASGSVPAQTRDGFPVRMGPKVYPGPADTYVAYGEGWANVSNTPFREYKHWVHEGGISTPLIAHWPAGIKAQGELRSEPGHLIDIAATLVELAGVNVPTDTQPLEGRSLVPVFGGQPLEREAIYWEHEGNRAVRQGQWKLVSKHNRPWELYDLSRDRIEQNDLADQNPEKVQELVALYDAYAARARVLPWPVKEEK